MEWLEPREILFKASCEHDNYLISGLVGGLLDFCEGKIPRHLLRTFICNEKFRCKYLFKNFYL